jgi:uncharacterized protein
MAEPGQTRRVPVWLFVVAVVVYLAVLQGLGLLLTRGIGTKYAAPTSVNELWRTITVPVGVSLVLVLAATAVLRWWRPVLTEHKPVQRWVGTLAVIMIVAALLSTNYSGLANRGLGFTLLLLLSTLMVGAAEEGMFRGIGLTVFRTNGFSEGKVALWSSIIFGLAHASNLISTGPKAFVQVLITAVAGYVFYLVRRRSGGLLLPAVVHGLWDFSLISSSVVPGRGYFGPAVNVIGLVAVLVVLMVRRRRIEPDVLATAVPGRSGQ